METVKRDDDLENKSIIHFTFISVEFSPPLKYFISLFGVVSGLLLFLACSTLATSDEGGIKHNRIKLARNTSGIEVLLMGNNQLERPKP